MLPSGYDLHQGSRADRTLLSKFLRTSYREFFPETGSHHLQETVSQYFTSDSSLWWVKTTTQDQTHVACLWMGVAIDQITGDRHSHIFLLYVKPKHRRQGIGRALMAVAEEFAKSRGDGQMTLQVFTLNHTARQFYESLNYAPYSLTMLKSLSS